MNHQMDLLGTVEPDRWGAAAAGFEAPSFDAPEFNGSATKPDQGIPPLPQPRVVPHRLILIGISSLLVAIGATLMLMRLRPENKASASPSAATGSELSTTTSEPHIFCCTKA